MPQLLGGIGLVLRDRYLLLIALLVVLLNWINTTGEFILADFVQRDAVARVAASGGALDMGALIAAFYGDFQFWVTLIGLAIQLFLVSRIYRTVGVRGALLIHPSSSRWATACWRSRRCSVGFVPIFTLIRLDQDRARTAIDYSLMNTTRQALFLPVDRDSKYEGKTAIDTFFWRFGDLIQAGAVYVGLNLLHWAGAAVRAAEPGAGARWIGLAVAIGRDFSRKALENVIERRARGGRADSRPASTSRVSRFQHPVSPTAFQDADPGDVLNLHGPLARRPAVAALDAIRRAAAGASSAGAGDCRSRN